MAYAIVQQTLEQTIDRKLLEEASVHVPSVARADCARIGSQLFGIVVTGLTRDEAIAFQTALEHYDFPTEVIPQENLPLLSPPKFRRGIQFQPHGFVAIDGLGREDGYPWEEVQFAAGGFLDTLQIQTKNELEWNHEYSPSRGRVGSAVHIRQRHEDVKEREFRLEFFLSCEPYRLQFRAGKETVFRFDGAMLRYRQQDQFQAILHRVAGIVPPDSQNLGLLSAGQGQEFTYPSIPAFEEEVVWQLFQRLRQ